MQPTLQLFIDTNLLPTLLDGTLKIILSGQAKGVLPTWQSNGVRLLRFQRIKEHTAVLYETAEPKSLTELQFPPSHTCVLWSFSEKETSELKRLQQWWKSWGPKDALPPLQFGSFEAMQTFVINRLTQEVSHLAHRNTDLHLAMASLREEHQATRKVLLGFQETIHSLKLARRHMIATYPPTDATMRIGEDADERSHSLHQLIPFPAKGLAGVDIFIQRQAEGQGMLLASLIARDNNQELASWGIPFTELQRGWLHLALPEICHESFARVELVLQYLRLQGEPPLFGLCPPVAHDEYYLRRNQTMLMQKTLALRLWGGLPGTRNTKPQYLRSSGFPEEFEYALSSSDLAKAVRTREIHAGFEYIQSLPGNQLLLHPVHDQVVSAVIHGIVPAGTYRMSANVSIDHDRCESPVEFAFAIAPGFSETPDPSDETSLMTSSGWMRVEQPWEQHLLELELDEPMANPGDLYLFTRADPDRSIDFAHAIFSNITITTSLQQAMARSRDDILKFNKELAS